MASDSSSSGDSDETQTLYHWTNKHSASEIARSGLIKKSKGSPGTDDARYGEGVYLTSFNQRKSEYEVAKNNFGEAWKKNIHKVKVAIELTVLTSKVKHKSKDRNVYLYDGDLYLTDAKPFCFHVRSYKTYRLAEMKEKYN